MYYRYVVKMLYDTYGTICDEHRSDLFGNIQDHRNPESMESEGI